MFQRNSLSLDSVLLQDPSEMSAECSNGVLTSLTTQSISWQCKDRILYTSHTQHRQGNVETFPVWQSRRRQELSDIYRAHKKFETILMWKFWNDGFLRIAIGTGCSEMTADFCTSRHLTKTSKIWHEATWASRHVRQTRESVKMWVSPLPKMKVKVDTYFPQQDNGKIEVRAGGYFEIAAVVTLNFQVIILC